MKCIILAAGYATRLYPLTFDIPKPLLQVGTKKVLEHILDKLAPVTEISEIYIVTNKKFLPEFKKWQENYGSEKKISVISDGTASNEDRLGAIGDINFVIQEKNLDDDLLVIAGDNLFEFDLNGLTSFFTQKSSTSIALSKLSGMEEAKKMGVVEIDKACRIVRFEEKPQHPRSTLVSTACYMFSREDISEIKNSKHCDRSGDFIAELSKKKPVFGYIITGKWYDIGSFEQLEEARKVFG